MFTYSSYRSSNTMLFRGLQTSLCHEMYRELFQLFTIRETAFIVCRVTESHKFTLLGPSAMKNVVDICK